MTDIQKDLGIPLTSEVLVDFDIGFIKDFIYQN